MSHAPSNITADDALARLIAGNERFRRGDVRSVAPKHETIAELARGQHPFATILGCSDSRVPPEWIFDAGLGELFVIRVAGNVLSPEVAGSLQYAGSHLGTPLFVVLGHEGCGAVSATLAAKEGQSTEGARIRILIDHIMPAIPDFAPDLVAAEETDAGSRGECPLDREARSRVAGRTGPDRRGTHEDRRRDLRDRDRPRPRLPPLHSASRFSRSRGFLSLRWSECEPLFSPLCCPRSPPLRASRRSTILSRRRRLPRPRSRRRS